MRFFDCRTKKAAAYCRAMIAGVEKIDDEFLYDLIARHPRAAEKIGAGIVGFAVKRLQLGKHGFGFVLYRADGTWTDFSYRVCVSGKESSAIAEVKSALRAAIADDVIALRRATLTDQSLCQLCGAKLRRENVHVDHVEPFDEIAMDWLAGRPLPALLTGDGITGARLAFGLRLAQRIHRAFRAADGYVVRAVARLGVRRRQGRPILPGAGDHPGVHPLTGVAHSKYAASLPYSSFTIRSPRL